MQACGSRGRLLAEGRAGAATLALLHGPSLWCGRLRAMRLRSRKSWFEKQEVEATSPFCPGSQLEARPSCCILLSEPGPRPRGSGRGTHSGEREGVVGPPLETALPHPASELMEHLLWTSQAPSWVLPVQEGKRCVSTAGERGSPGSPAPSPQKCRLVSFPYWAGCENATLPWGRGRWEPRLLSPEGLCPDRGGRSCWGSEAPTHSRTGHPSLSSTHPHPKPRNA